METVASNGKRTENHSPTLFPSATVERRAAHDRYVLSSKQQAQAQSKHY